MFCKKYEQQQQQIGSLLVERKDTFHFQHIANAGPVCPTELTVIFPAENREGKRKNIV